MRFKFTVIVFTIGLALSSISLRTCLGKETRAVATLADGLKIPILVLTPEGGAGPFPVVYHVHGGGWNGGTKTEVPPAGLPPESRLLCDRLGLIYVGLAYRCKDQNGTFAKALDDLRASIRWFEQRAPEFQADLKRVGFSGGSAGTPLSSVLAQESPNCKTYVGLFGVYNLLDNSASLFPDEEARRRYGLTSRQQQMEASAYHQLRSTPPESLLFHGGKDILTHPSQSVAFAKRIQSMGGKAEAIVFPDVNHGYFNPRYRDEYRTTCLRIAKLYQRNFELGDVPLLDLNSHIDRITERYVARSTIDAKSVLGTWQGKAAAYDFSAMNVGTWTKGKQSRPFKYAVVDGILRVHLAATETDFFMTEDGRELYYMVKAGRHAGRREVFVRGEPASR